MNRGLFGRAGRRQVLINELSRIVSPAIAVEDHSPERQWRRLTWPPAGTAFPTDPTDYQQFIRTDLDWPNRFEWDPVRSKWLGVDPISCFMIMPSTYTAATWLSFDSAVSFSASRGYRFPFTTTLVGARLDWETSATFDLQIREDGSSSVKWEVSISAASRYEAFDLDHDFSADVYLGARANNYSSGTITRPNGEFYVRRLAA